MLINANNVAIKKSPVGIKKDRKYFGEIEGRFVLAVVKTMNVRPAAVKLAVSNVLERSKFIH